LTVVALPNGLAFSWRLETIRLIDWENVLPLLDAKMAPIQPLSWNAVLARRRIVALPAIVKTQ
jgi:hypothetical protein